MRNFDFITETPKELAIFMARTCRDLLAKVVENGGQVPPEDFLEENDEVWLEWLEKNLPENIQ